MDEIIESLSWLVNECHHHNASYHHVTDKPRLARIEVLVKTLVHIMHSEHLKLTEKEDSGAVP